MTLTEQRQSGKGLGIMLLVVTILQLVLAAHHPSVDTAHAPKDILASIAHFALLDRFIHGALILMYAASLIGFRAFDALLLNRGELQRCAFAIYLAGFTALVAAAILDGFVTADFATAFAFAAEDTIASAMVVLAAIGMCIQVFTKLGLLLFSAAIFLWGLALLRQPRRLYFLAGLAFFAVFAPIVLMMILGSITAKGVVLLVLSQAVFTLAVAWILWDGKLLHDKVPA